MQGARSLIVGSGNWHATMCHRRWGRETSMAATLFILDFGLRGYIKSLYLAIKMQIFVFCDN